MMFRNNSPLSTNFASLPSLTMRRSNSRGFDQMTPLAPDFVPGDDDVLVGRGKKCLTHTGNQRFKQIITTKLQAYLKAECRVDKTAILMEVIARVRSNSPNGGFVKQNPKTGQFFEVGDFLAKEKTAQAFRDSLHENYSSSNPSKKKRRIQSTAATTTSEEKPAASISVIQEEKSDTTSMAGSSKPAGQTLVSAMHTQFAQSVSGRNEFHSAPASPVRNDYMIDPSRRSTPPPFFARFVSEEPLPEPLLMMFDREESKDRAAKRKSSMLHGDTLALLKSALTDTDFETGAIDDSDFEDPFEPLPL